MSTALATTSATQGLQGQEAQVAILRALNLDPKDPNTQALVMTCERYGLDPLLKHAVLIQKALYVTRDGLLHVAHSSGQLDGLEVEMLEATDSHYVAKATVWRKDMSRPFVYQGRYPKAGRGGPGAQFGPEMAEKVAECRALRRAFSIALCSREETWEEIEADTPTQAPRNVTPTQPGMERSASVPLRSAPPKQAAPPPDWDPRAEFVTLATDRGLDILNDEGKPSASKIRFVLCEIYGTTGVEMPTTKLQWDAALKALQVHEVPTKDKSPALATTADDLEDPFGENQS